MADILRVAAHPCSKTQILYAANLSYEQAKRYCEMLVSVGMLSKLDDQSEESGKFLTTASGGRFLSQMSRFGKIAPGESSVWERKDAQV